MFIIGSAAAVLLLGWPDFAAGRFGGGFVLLFALVFGVIGYIDDYVKVKKHQNTGLTAPQKFLLQLAAAIVFTVLMRNHHYLTPDLYIPFVNVTLSLPWPVYMVFAAFVMVGTVNAVNITDGTRRTGHRRHHARDAFFHRRGLLLGATGAGDLLRRAVRRAVRIPDL